MHYQSTSILSDWHTEPKHLKLCQCSALLQCTLTGGRCCPVKLLGVYHSNALVLWCVCLKRTLRVEIMQLVTSLVTRGTLG